MSDVCNHCHNISSDLSELPLRLTSSVGRLCSTLNQLVQAYHLPLFIIHLCLHMHTSHIRVILEVISEGTVVGLHASCQHQFWRNDANTYSKETQRQSDR